jgi:hypothetical protein
MTSLRRAGIAVLIALALLLGADAAIWYWVTGQMLTAIADWQATTAARGLRVQYAPPQRAGWPFSAEIQLPAVTIDAGLASWQGGMVRLNLSPLQPTTLAIAVSGPQSLRLGGWPPVAIEAHRLDAIMPLNGPRQVIVDASGITASLPAGSLEIGLLAARVDDGGVQIDASHLVITGAHLPFGGAIDRVAGHLRATVPLPAEVANSGVLDPAQAAAAWHHANGMIVLSDAAIRWGQLDAQGHFTTGLDDGLQPTGEGSIHLTGYREAIDALTRAGTISRNTGRVAETLLDMMSTSAAGDPPTVDVPLTLRDGTLAMGAIPLARLPRLAWP